MAKKKQLRVLVLTAAAALLWQGWALGQECVTDCTCIGDCNTDNAVDITELVTSVKLVLTGGDVTRCALADGNEDGEIAIDDIMRAVNRALDGCAAIVRMDIAANDMLLDPMGGETIYASVPTRADKLPDTIIAIDPHRGTFRQVVQFSAEPGPLAASDDGQFIYVGLASGNVSRIRRDTETIDATFSLGTNAQGAVLGARDLEVLPGAPHSVAVLRTAGDVSSAGVVVFDDTVARPQEALDSFAQDIAFVGSSEDLFGFAFGGRLNHFRLGDSGVQVIENTSGLLEYSLDGNRFPDRFEPANGLLYTTSGKVINPLDKRLVGSLGSCCRRSVGGLVQIASDLGTIFSLGTEFNGNYRVVLRSFDVNALTPLQTFRVPDLGGDATGFVRWGTMGLAYSIRDLDYDRDALYLIRALPPADPFVRPVPETIGPTTQLRVRANHMVYASSTDTLYVSVPSAAGEIGNSIVAIDPQTGGIESATHVGSEPGILALSGDEAFLYAALQGSASIVRLSLPSLAMDLEFSLGVGEGSSPLRAGDLEVVPGDSRSIAVVLSDAALSSPATGLAIYHDATGRVGNTSARPNVITFSDSASRFYGFDNDDTGAEFSVLTRIGSSVGAIRRTEGLIRRFTHDILFHGGLIYATSGQVIDPEQLRELGQFDAVGPVAPDDSAGVVFFLDRADLRAFDQHTFGAIGQFSIPGGERFATGQQLIRWGAGGLAAVMDDRVVLVTDWHALFSGS